MGTFLPPVALRLCQLSLEIPAMDGTYTGQGGRQMFTIQQINPSWSSRANNLKLDGSYHEDAYKSIIETLTHLPLIVERKIAICACAKVSSAPPTLDTWLHLLQAQICLYFIIDNNYINQLNCGQVLSCPKALLFEVWAEVWKNNGVNP